MSSITDLIDVEVEYNFVGFKCNLTISAATGHQIWLCGQCRYILSTNPSCGDKCKDCGAVVCRIVRKDGTMSVLAGPVYHPSHVPGSRTATGAQSQKQQAMPQGSVCPNCNNFAVHPNFLTATVKCHHCGWESSFYPAEDTPKMAQVKIWYDTSIDGYKMSSPYNQSFVDLFKSLVPISDRTYDKPTRIWTFTERFLDPTAALVEQVFKVKPTIVSKQQVQSSQMPTSVRLEALDVSLAKFMRILPYDAALKAYRLAALELHPDRNPGSSMDKMSALNSLWTKIEKELYGKGKPDSGTGN